MGPEQRDMLVERFRAYLDEADPDAPIDDDAEPTDLYTIFVELAALKSEVKLESRQVKSALDEFKNIFDLLQHNHQRLDEALQNERARQEEREKALLRPLLLDLLELHDRLAASLQALRQHKPSRLAWLSRREAVQLRSFWRSSGNHPAPARTTARRSAGQGLRLSRSAA